MRISQSLHESKANQLESGVTWPIHLLPPNGLRQPPGAVNFTDEASSPPVGWTCCWEAAHTGRENAVKRRPRPNAASRTQNVAMQSILFLYKQVLGIELTGIQALRAKKDKRLPVALTKTEVLAVREQITDPLFRLQAKLHYGTGMRLLECLRLRVKDVDFEKHRDGPIARDTPKVICGFRFTNHS